MDTFSQRFGFKSKKNTIQIESIDDDLRNSLWNVLVLSFWKNLEGYLQIDYDEKESYPERNNVKRLVKLLWFSHFKKTFDELLGFWPKDYRYVKEIFFSINGLKCMTSWNSLQEITQIILHWEVLSTSAMVCLSVSFLDIVLSVRQLHR